MHPYQLFLIASKKEVSDGLTSFISDWLVCLWTYEFNVVGGNLKRPLVGVVNTAAASRMEFPPGVIAPGKQAVTALHQIGDDDIVVPAQLIASIAAFSVSSRLT